MRKFHGRGLALLLVIFGLWENGWSGELSKKTPRASRAPLAAAGRAAPQAARVPIFRFSGGERIRIFVLGLPDGSFEQLVTSGGVISAPASGTLNVRGLTLEEATREVARKIRSIEGLKTPRVSISILSLPPRRVYVEGEVKEPRAIALPADQRLTLAAALAAAGGATPDADLGRIKVVRRNARGTRQAILVDGWKFGRSGGEGLGPMLHSGDVVLIPRAAAFAVSGEVLKPGIVTRADTHVPPGRAVRLSQAIAAAGGTAAAADKRLILVLRTGAKGARVVLHFDLEAALKKGRLEGDPVLRDGDQVIVPHGDGIVVMGRVRLPGVYYPPGGKVPLSRLLAMAGGFDQYAKKSSVVVVRKEQPGKPLKVNLKAILQAGALEQDLEVHSGDRVFVGESAF